MERIYDALLKKHDQEHRQMAFLSGPRQVGKTTTTKAMHVCSKKFQYVNWDIDEDRKLILDGVRTFTEFQGLHIASSKKPIVVLDEIHKFSRWKNFLKGIFDLNDNRVFFIVTGSSRLDVYRRGGDSLMGRYFSYRYHPLSLAELVSTRLPNEPVRPFFEGTQRKSKEKSLDFLEHLSRFGGFPEPFLKGSEAFLMKWKKLRKEKLFREDLRDLSQIQDLALLELLGTFIENQATQIMNYSRYSKDVGVSIDTIRRWVELLQSFYFCFLIRPWFKNVKKSLLKEPKVYLWDWSPIQDAGARFENLIASHLLKFVHFWTDQGVGEFGLYYLRDQLKNEVDFLVVRNQEPWILVESKLSSKQGMNSSLYTFQKNLQVPYAFQVVLDLPMTNSFDLFSIHQPTIVSARDFLQRLI